MGCFFIMGRITGLEPATFGTTNQRSNQLSYIRHTVCACCAKTKNLSDLIGLEPTSACCMSSSTAISFTSNSGGADRT